tara:strand:- start:1977 stop:2546 length:570 start_codon:yes stop_codon:yes gene_type:complete
MLLGILNSQAAGGGGAAYELLESVTLSTDTASVTFDNLDSYSDYKHLQIRGIARANTSGYATQYILFNGDTGSNYTTHKLTGSSSSSTVSSGSNVNEAYIRFANVDRASQSVNDAFAPSVVDIYDFASTNKKTTVRVLEGRVGGDPTQSTNRVAINSGLWNNTAAVTSIEFKTFASYVAGTRFALIGVR